MANTKGLVVNLDLCMGCFACEFACRQEHNLPEGTFGMLVQTLGPHEIEGRLVMDFVPHTTDHCDLCAERTAKGERPFCAQVCPTQALSFLDGREILGLLGGGRRFQLCKATGPQRKGARGPRHEKHSPTQPN